MSPEAKHGGENLTQEIERKFLITALPPELDLNSCKATKIDQGYLMADSTAAVRVRRKGDKYFMTYKRASDSHSAARVELVTELSAEQFETLWPGTEGRRVEKTRYEIPFGSHVIELDIFAGENAGHMLAEVEFTSTEAADVFQPPAWFHQDVTPDPRFGNSSIADRGFPVL